MIDGVVGNKSLAESVREDIIERTDGIPLFVEELTKAVLEAESHRAAEHAIAVIPPPALEVPASLHASLMARLDRLGPAKEVAQIGAAIGREFSHPLLAAASRAGPRRSCRAALDSSRSRPVCCYRQGYAAARDVTCSSMPLIRDAAYGTQLREPRRALHMPHSPKRMQSQRAEIAETPARDCWRVTGPRPDMVEKAATPWGRAGAAVGAGALGPR